MADFETVPVHRNDGTWLDLRHVSEMEPERAGPWRADVARYLEAGSVMFVGPENATRHDGGAESPAQPDPASLTGPAVDEVYTPAGLDRLIEKENANAFDLLVAQTRSPMGVVPFVGAGLSVSFGFPSWPTFLEQAAALCGQPESVRAEVAKGHLIEAAQILYDDSRERFPRLVERWFAKELSPEQLQGQAVDLLPLIARGPVITTNFDHVLETAYAHAGFPFDGTVTGQQADSVIRAMHRNEHVLIKLHGDAADSSARVFTGLEYQQSYGAPGPLGSPTPSGRGTIPTLARIMFTNRPLLFLGCSMEHDRVLDVLQELHESIPGLGHFAVLAAPWSVRKLRDRRHELDRYGVSPLWFAPGRFHEIRSLLEVLLSEASTRLLWRAPRPSSQPVHRGDRWAGLSRRPRGTQARPPQNPELRSTIKRLADRVIRGRIAFLLGAGCHLRPSIGARQFYASLARDYGFAVEDAQRAEAAQFVIDREGKSEAWATARQLLPSRDARPSPVFEFLGELPGLLRKPGRFAFAEQWFLTTNYDVTLEDVLEDRGEAFHLLSYQVDGAYEGTFVHRAPDGSLRVIERPQSVRAFAERASVVVKLDGGISWDEHIPETVAMSPLDFSISAGRLPAALPEAVRRALLERSLLILGSSMRDVHVQRLVRWCAGTVRACKTWAVLTPVTPTAAQFWSAAGVELIDCDLEWFVGELNAEIDRLLNAE